MFTADSSHFVVSSFGARKLVDHLIYLSTPFFVEPLPEDTYAFTVKTEVIKRIYQFLSMNEIAYNTD